jgi:hypothetical protein
MDAVTTLRTLFVGITGVGVFGLGTIWLLLGRTLSQQEKSRWRTKRHAR